MIRSRAAAVRAVVVPDWLAEVVRPRPVAPPWPDMFRATLAICAPLAVALALGKGTLGVLPAMGGLLGTIADTGGPYLSRVRRVGSAAVLGGAVGLVIGSVTHGHGWLALVALVAVAGVSGVVSSVGDIGSITGLQLLVYTGLGAGPVGAQRPVWHTAAGFLAGVIWALILIVPGWLLSPHGKEQRDVAAVYGALAQELRAVGSSGFTSRRQALTGALNIAYDELLTARSTAAGRNGRIAGLVAVLNASHLMAEAATALGVAGIRPPPLIIETVERLADSIRDGTLPPMIPPPWGDSPAMLTLRDAMAGAARALSRDWSPEQHPRPGLRDRWQAGVGTGQRGLGTIVGAVAGAVLLVLVHGTWLLIPFAVLAALLPYGRSRNYGLLSTFLTPLVVVLIDLLAPAGWRLAEDRLVDTLIGCAIALGAGFAPWPMSWYAHLPRQFARTTLDVCEYMQEALRAPDADARTSGPGPDHGVGGGARPPARSRMRRATYRALADLRAEFQRTMSEPPSISRGATAWWPAVVALEQVTDAVTAVALAVSRGAEVPPSQVAVLSAVLRAVNEAAATGTGVQPPSGLPEDETLKPVTESVRALLGVLGHGQPLTIRD